MGLLIFFLFVLSLGGVSHGVGEGEEEEKEREGRRTEQKKREQGIAGEWKVGNVRAQKRGGKMRGRKGKEERGRGGKRRGRESK